MSETEIALRASAKLFIIWSPVLIPILIGLVIGIKKENEQERMAMAVKRLEIEGRKTA